MMKAEFFKLAMLALFDAASVMGRELSQDEAREILADAFPLLPDAYIHDFLEAHS